MFVHLSWQLPDGTDRELVLGMPVEPVTNAITLAVDTARQLVEPVNLRRAFHYAEPWLPVVADIAGLGIAGQLVLHAGLSLARRALGAESDVAQRPS